MHNSRPRIYPSISKGNRVHDEIACGASYAAESIHADENTEDHVETCEDQKDFSCLAHSISEPWK